MINSLYCPVNMRPLWDQTEGVISLKVSLQPHRGGSSAHISLPVAEDGSAPVTPTNTTISHQMRRSQALPCLRLPRVHFLCLIHFSGSQLEVRPGDATGSHRSPHVACPRLPASEQLGSRYGVTWCRLLLTVRTDLEFCFALKGCIRQSPFNEARAGNS